MRRRQSRNGNNRFRPVTTIWGSALKIALYIYIQAVCTNRTAHTHDSGSKAVLWESCQRIWNEYRRHTGSPALFAFSYLGEQRRRRNTPIWIHSSLTKNVQKCVMRLTFLLCCCECCAHAGLDKKHSIGPGNDFPMNYALMEGCGAERKRRHCCFHESVFGELKASILQ